MTPANATAHHALTHSAGNARVYAEALLNRICRKWGMSREELRTDGTHGRQARRNIVHSAVLAEFFVGIEHMRNGWGGVPKNDHLSFTEIGSIIGMSRQNVGALYRTLGRYLDKPRKALGPIDLVAAATDSSLRATADPSVCQPNSSDPTISRFTGHDRAALEEAVEGGFAP